MGLEPIGGMKKFSLPAQELVGVPIGADSVELFAEPPASGIGDAIPTFGQEEWRRLRRFSSGGTGGEGTIRADARFLGRVAAQLAQMFASSLLNRNRLI